MASTVEPQDLARSHRLCPASGARMMREGRFGSGFPCSYSSAPAITSRSPLPKLSTVTSRDARTVADPPPEDH